MDRWRDRVAVVTGASEGIGEAIVRKLAASGMKVAALARRQQLLEALEKEVTAAGGRGSVKGFPCDVTSREEVFTAFKRVETELGPVAVIVNNAGVLKQTVLNHELNLDDAQAIIDVNVMGVLNCTKAALQSMNTNNIQDGHIINISSMIAHMDTVGYPEYATYGASKSALNVLTKSIKYQLSKDKSKIRVSTVDPGLIETSMTRGVVPSFEHVPHLKPDDIASTVVYVLSAPPHVNIREIMVEAT